MIPFRLSPFLRSLNVLKNLFVLTFPASQVFTLHQVVILMPDRLNIEVIKKKVVCNMVEREPV